MKLELNKRYIRRDGEVTGPLEAKQNDLYMLRDPKYRVSYTLQGQLYAEFTDDWDLIAEYVEPIEPKTQRLTSPYAVSYIEPVAETQEMISRSVENAKQGLVGKEFKAEEFTVDTSFDTVVFLSNTYDRQQKRIEELEDWLARSEEQVTFWEKRDHEHQVRIQELEDENARLKAELEALRPKPSVTSKWYNCYSNGSVGQAFNSREEVEIFVSKNRVAVLRIDTYSDGRVEAVLEPLEGEKG